MNGTMKASILFITYKHEGYVAEAIRSAMAQDHPDLELVVCDDASPDDTRAILEEELKHCPPHISIVRAHSNKNCGLHENFNRGLAACTGDIVVSMSGDDVSMPNRVSRICKEFDSDPNCMLVCSNWLNIDEMGVQHGLGRNPTHDTVYSYCGQMNSIYAGAPICGAAAAYRICLRDSFPPMMRGRHGEDNCYWFRALLHGCIHYISSPLVKWRRHSGSISNWGLSTEIISNRYSKHISYLKSHELFWRQWVSDLEFAYKKSIISYDIYKKINGLIKLSCENYRLDRFSISGANISLWLYSLKRFYYYRITHQKKLSINIKHFKLRFFPSSRKKYFNSKGVG
jgi:glycosyltransferase involved in cell wall biosynthesis